MTGEYALHLQCPWRISGRAGIVVGWADMYVPNDPAMSEWEFDAGRPGNAVADIRLKDWIAAYEARPLVVVRIDADRCGGFVLQLSEGFAFEVFPSEAQVAHNESEQWRLFQPGRETPHFVLGSRGPSTE